MNTQDIIQKTAEFARKTLEKDTTGHDWWHVYRVWNNAKKIGAGEKANMFVVELAALLHDIADHKFHGGDHSVGPKKAREWLDSQNVDDEIIVEVVNIISNMSFSSSLAGKQVTTIEGMVVQDADRLDALGAIGIARCFAYGGSKGHEMYNPDKQVRDQISPEQYAGEDGTQINHFYEKLFLLKDKMNTKTAKLMAEERDVFMHEFVDRFISEWEGIE